MAEIGAVEAIEVYRRPADIPVEFSQYDSVTNTLSGAFSTGSDVGGCGVLVVWTTRGDALRRGAIVGTVFGLGMAGFLKLVCEFTCSTPSRAMSSFPRLSAWLLALVLPACLITEPLTAQAIRGLVLERVTDRPIGLGRVALIEVGGDTVATATTDGRGFFSVTAEDPGDYRVVVEAFGYRHEDAGPYELDRGDVRVVQINLEPAPFEIRGIDVEAEDTATPYLVRQGFTERRKMGFGHFLGPRELDDLRVVLRSTEEIFYRLPGVTLGPGEQPLMTASSGGGCIPVPFVDGVRVRKGRVRDSAPLEHLEAIEIYTRAAQVPLQYSWAAQGCGVVLYWTKH